MTCKSLHITLNKFISGPGIIFLVIIYSTIASGQSNISGYSDVAKQRLLVRITAHYIHTISQGQIDMDSAVRIPCKLYGLSPLLIYNEGYSDGKSSAGTKLLDAGKVKGAISLLTKLRDEARLRLLIELGSYFVFKPGTEKADLDQASKYTDEAIMLSKNKALQWKIESLTLRAYLLHQSGLRDESQKVFAEILKLCERSGNSQAVARTLLISAQLLQYGDPLRLPKFEKAQALFQSQHAKEKEIETLSEINVEHFVFKRYDLAEQVTRRIIELETQINFRHRQYAYDVLSYLYQINGQLANALSYSNKSLESLHTRADSVFISFFYGRRANLYSSLDKDDEALVWYNKALGNKSNETRLYWYKTFLSEVKLLNNLHREKEALSLLKETGRQFPPVTIFEKMYFAISLGQAYEQQKKFDLAKSNYRTFLNLAENLPIEYVHSEFPQAFSQISSLYRIIGDTGGARALLDANKHYFFQLGSQGRGLYYYDLFKIDSTEKRYLDAIKDLQLGNKLIDSAFSDDQRKKSNELLVKYEAEKKDKDIKLLNSQNQLQRIRAEDADRTKNITFVGVGLLLIITGLLFNRYLIKQRSNRKLEVLNAEQDKLLKEKEWLIKEVHHRVKNNLQMVTSLLYSQSIYLEDDAAVVAVKDSLRRMQAMSLIHQKLYLDENITTIAMPEYINELVSYLHESFDTSSQIVFEQNIEPLNLDVSQAIPLGLIINESIVNAIKYAFLNGEKGTVSIDLKHDGPDHLLLKISDNGIGLPAELDLMKHNSLGLDLIKGLAKQLKGSFTIENNKGVHILVRFMSLNK